MKIIQSYAQYISGSPYVSNNQLKGTETYANFYSFLLSYLCLKKYYENVRMYTNQLGFDTVIKFIPYDEIVIKENKYDGAGAYWSFYKVDMINETDGGVVHVDCDVFLFDDHLKPIINGNYDGIVQDIVTKKRNKEFSLDFVNENRNVFKEWGIFNPDLYDGRCFSCGVIGMKKNLKAKYIEIAYGIKNNLDKNIMTSRYKHLGGISEELGFYLTAIKENANIYSILPYDELLKNEENYNAVANKHKYTHLWFLSKYMAKNVELIKNKIKRDFPEYYSYVEIFENWLVKNNIKINLL